MSIFHPAVRAFLTIALISAAKATTYGVAHIAGTFQNPSGGDPEIVSHAGENTSLFTWGVPIFAPGGILDTEPRLLADDNNFPIVNGFGDIDILALPGQFSEADIYPNIRPGHVSGIRVSDYTLLTGRTLLESSSFLEFTPQSVDVGLGEEFVLGTLRFNNGTAIWGTGVDSVFLNITSSSATPAFQQNLSLQIAIGTTANIGTPAENADFIYFPEYPEFGSFRVLEGDSAEVELKGFFNSLHFTGFGQTQGGGFLNPSITEPLQSVPESGPTIGLMVIGAAALGCLNCKGRPRPGIAESVV